MPLSFPVEWTVFLDNRITPEMVRTSSTELDLIPSTKIQQDPFYRVDFTILNKTIPPCSRAAAFYEFESDAECEVTIGIVGDWWFVLYLNGEPVYDCLAAGNGESVHAIYARPLKCHIRKGKNTFAVYLESGSCGCSFDIGLIPEKIPVREEAQNEFLDYFFPPDFSILTQPWLLAPGKDSMTIAAAFKHPCGAALEFRPVGSSLFQRTDDAEWGQCKITSFHKFELKGLKPDTRYEYKILIRDGNEELKSFGPYHFTTLRENMDSHSIFFTSDTQISPNHLHLILETFSDQPFFKNNDLFVHLGDIQGGYQDDFDRFFSSSLLSSLQPHTNGEIPIVMVRGNHEYRGNASLDFISRTGAPYGAFVFGEVFYLKLDSGWDSDAGPSIQWRDRTEEYMRQQKAWLDRIVESDEWKKARYHVVLVHATPCYDFSPVVTRNIQMLAGDLFLGKTPYKKIDLWLCGHTHAAARFDVESQKYLTAAPTRHTFRFDPERKYMVPDNAAGISMDYICLPFKFISFPVIVMDGPEGNSMKISAMRLDVSPEGLHLRHFNSVCELIDEIFISPDHKLRIGETKLRPVAEQQAKLKK